MKPYHYSQVTEALAHALFLRPTQGLRSAPASLLAQDEARRDRRARKRVNRWRQRWQRELRHIAADLPKMHAVITGGLAQGIPPGRLSPIQYAVVASFARRAAAHISLQCPELLSDLGARLVADPTKKAPPL